MSFIPPDHYDAQIAQRYVQQLAQTPAMSIEQFLESEPSPTREHLETIIKADMGFRWQKLNFAGPVEAAQATFVKPPNVERYAKRFAELHKPDKLQRLILWEVSLRQKIGDHPSVAEYAKRFPQLEDIHDWLTDDTGSSHWAPGDDRRIGTTLGSYKIESKIGEGALTVSYRAIQFRPVRDQVVLKIVKSDVNSTDVIDRFRFELPALANMCEAHIINATHADVTADGATYFVMPWVDGRGITDYVREEELELPQRLALFLDVCEAVQHAHLKGTIHHDLKPSNLLVVDEAGQPMVKIVDFGIARAIGHRLGKRTVASHFGTAQHSLQYISPEQASFNPADIDTRSDVYSLGTVLYELLTGKPPFSQTDLDSKAIDQTLRIIRKQQPDPPSERTAGLPVELNWITLKALAKDREQRYQSPRELADDLRGYMNGKAVAAAPPSWRYGMTKFITKNWIAILVVMLVFILVLIAAVIVTWKIATAASLAASASWHSLVGLLWVAPCLLRIAI